MQSLNQDKCCKLLEYLVANDIDIACLSETWFKDIVNFQTTLLAEGGNFKVYNKPRLTETIGGGVCILIKNKYKSVFQRQRSFSSFECIIILCCLSGLPSQKLKLVAIYRREAVVFSTFIDEFFNLVNELTISKYPFIVGGDFNIHMNETGHSYTKRFSKLCRELNLDLSNVPSSKTHIAGNILDFIVSDHCVSSKITDTLVDEDAPSSISHHFPILYKLNSSLQCRALAAKRTTRNFLHFKLDDFKQDLSASLADLNNHHSFEEKYSCFQNHLATNFNKHAPMVNAKINHNERPKWMDHDFVLERAYRRKLERLYKHTRSSHDHIKFKLQRTKCSLLVDEKRSNFYTNLILTSKGNTKTLFNTYEKLVGDSLNKSRNLPDVDNFGSSFALASSFKKYFSEKVKKAQDHIDNENLRFNTTENVVNEALPDMEDTQYLSSFRPCDMPELKEIITKYGIKLTAEIDPLSRSVMSDSLEVLLPHLLDLVNTSLSTGCLDGVKYSFIKPLLKKIDLDCSEFSSYRPISNLSFISKLVERVVARRLHEHMTLNKLHEDSQHGYKAGHSTETLLIKFMNDILVAIDKNRGVVVLLIDLSSAFDTVQHKLLLKILKDSLYIKGSALQWFTSFLSGRTQSVIIDGIHSDWLTVTCGVPQGSVLGPILFNIYCRHIHCVFEDCGFTSSSYADDNSALKSFALFNQVNVLHKEVPNCIAKLKKYMNQHYLKLNDGKTEIIVFGNSTFKGQLTINGTFLDSGKCIRFAESVKYLGVFFDSLLSFDKQITSIVSSSYASLRKISSMKKCVSKSDVETLVHAFISSKLDMCNSLYFGLPKKTPKKLQKVQNSAIRLVFNVRSRHPVSAFYAQLHWLNVEQRICFKVILIVYKCVNGSAPAVLQNMCVIRNNVDLTLRITYFNKSKYGKRAFVHYAPRYWNRLPVSIRLINNIDTFKSSLKSFILLNFDVLKQTT